MDEPTPPPERGLPDGLRSAIESTLSSIGEAGGSTASELGETLDRAGELLDQVAGRGADAGAEFARRGQQAAETSAALTARLVDAVRETLTGRDRPSPDPKRKPEGE